MLCRGKPEEITIVHEQRPLFARTGPLGRRRTCRERPRKRTSQRAVRLVAPCAPQWSYLTLCVTPWRRTPFRPGAAHILRECPRRIVYLTCPSSWSTVRAALHRRSCADAQCPRRRLHLPCTTRPPCALFCLRDTQPPRARRRALASHRGASVVPPTAHARSAPGPRIETDDQLASTVLRGAPQCEAHKDIEGRGATFPALRHLTSVSSRAAVRRFCVAHHRFVAALAQDTLTWPVRSSQLKTCAQANMRQTCRLTPASQLPSFWDISWRVWRVAVALGQEERRR